MPTDRAPATPATRPDLCGQRHAAALCSPRLHGDRAGSRTLPPGTACEATACNLVLGAIRRQRWPATIGANVTVNARSRPREVPLPRERAWRASVPRTFVMDETRSATRSSAASLCIGTGRPVGAMKPTSPGLCFARGAAAGKPARTRWRSPLLRMECSSPAARSRAAPRPRDGAVTGCARIRRCRGDVRRRRHRPSRPTHARHADWAVASGRPAHPVITSKKERQ